MSELTIQDGEEEYLRVSKEENIWDDNSRVLGLILLMLNRIERKL